MKRLLFVSNGYGEDMIGAGIIKALKQEKTLVFKSLPLVGEGKIYKNAGIEVIYGREPLPTGGFTTQSLFYFLKDVKAGLWKLIWNQIKVMRKIRPFIDLVVCIGDIYVVLLACLFMKKPIIFIATAKSDYIGKHYKIEEWVMRHWTKQVITRDKITASSLKRAGVNAIFVGNPMMDCLEITGEDFGLRKGINTIGLVPGSREEAYDNLIDILKIVASLANQVTVNFLLALAPSLSIEKIKKKIESIDWKVKETLREEKGIVRRLIFNKSNNFKLEVIITQGKFGDFLKISDLIIGLSGTANEQAVGLGKPVITFIGQGAQTTRRRLKEQKKLLGESLIFVKKEEVEQKIKDILNDKFQVEVMGKVKPACAGGRERMGEKGGIKRIARLIVEEVQ